MAGESKTQLLADQLRADPRVKQAEDLLLAALAEAQSKIDGPRSPNPDLESESQAMLDRLASARGGATYFPYLASGIGKGPWVELTDGSIKLDFIAGIGVHGLGHSHPSLVKAVFRSTLDDTVMQGNLQQHRTTVDMCERLVD